MKLLYCIFAICVAIEANPVPATRDELESLAKLILQDVKGALKVIDEVIDETERKVEKKLEKNEHVHKLQSLLIDMFEESTEATGDIREDLMDCSINILQGFRNLEEDINHVILQNLTERYGKKGYHLDERRKELVEMEDALNNHLDEEVESCLNKKGKCKLTGDFINKSEDFYKFEDLMKSDILSLAESYDEYFNTEEVRNKIVTDFVDPAYECINKLPK